MSGNFCIYCERVLPLAQLVVVDVAYDEDNQQVPLYTCQACSPVVWKHVQATRAAFDACPVQVVK
jgi:hypothetical protein